jgi:DNA-directed RNA polymerase omega subunit
LKENEDIDSKFRFVILASKRAKQLLAGSKPKLKSKSKNLIRIAQEEVKEGLVEYEIVPIIKEELEHTEDEAFIGEDLGENIAPKLLEKEKVQAEGPEKKSKKKEKSKKEPSKTKKTKKTG